MKSIAATMNSDERLGLSKVPEVTLAFWFIKIIATTLGEVGGNAVSMSMGLGYLLGTVIFVVPLIIAATAQIQAKRFNPFLYWTVITLTTLAGTTLADFFDRSLGIGYLGGSLSAIPRDRYTCYLVSVSWFCRHQNNQISESRKLLLGDHYVFSNTRNGFRRLDGRYGPWI